jgi:methionine synthase II (cobalamin-independent)
MLRSTDHIRTTHADSLPRPEALIERNSRRQQGQADDAAAYDRHLSEAVADRIVRFAEPVGRENVIAATDCGLGGRVHPQIAWAKLQSLADGAALASRRLFG